MNQHPFDPDVDENDPVPEVMFLPLAVPEEDGFGDLDPGVLARRIPDFVHQVLNQGLVGPTGVLEVQSPPEEGPVMWVVMDMPPEPDEAFDLLPDDADVRAIVTGELRAVPDGLHVEFHVYFAEDGSDCVTNKVGVTVNTADPVTGLLQLTRRLARLLELPFHAPPKGILTANAPAFFHFLRGLDNAMLLSGDLMIEVPVDCEVLMRPFAEALRLDPRFGLALRVAHTTTVVAMAGSRLDTDAARRFLDRCYSAQPFDGEGCVAVAEQLRDMGDEQRAMAWLEHASHLEPPPPRGLENLGILFANRGETIAARDLWLRGLDLDGHPDFCGHLARLHFAEDRALDAWEMIVRGLRRLHERIARAGEWDDDQRGAGVLLHYLQEDLDEREPPEEVVEGLLDLVGMLRGDDRVYLGLCLQVAGRSAEARSELLAAGELEDLLGEVRDIRARALLELEITDFDRRFTRACEQATRGRARQCLAEFQLWLDLQPQFWPAMYYSAIALRRLGDTEQALDLLAEVCRLAPGRTEVLHQMALLFSDRGNKKRALELVEEALMIRPVDATLWAEKVQLLLDLGRDDQALIAVMAGLEIDPGNLLLQKLRRRLPD